MGNMNYVNYDWGFFGYSDDQSGTVINYLHEFLKSHAQLIKNRNGLYTKDGILNGQTFNKDSIKQLENPNNGYFYKPEDLSHEDRYQIMTDLKKMYDDAVATKNKEKMFAVDTLMYGMGLHTSNLSREKPNLSPSGLVDNGYNFSYFKARAFVTNGPYDKYAQQFFETYTPKTPFSNQTVFNNIANDYKKGKDHEVIQKNLQKYIETGFDVNFRDNSGVSLLHLAAQYNDTETIRLLAAHGMNMNVETVDGKNALCYATTPQALKTLVELGVDINGGSINPLINHIQSDGNPELTQAFVELGADLFETYSDESVLSIAQTRAEQNPTSKNAQANLEFFEKTQPEKMSRNFYEQLAEAYGRMTPLDYANYDATASLLYKAVKKGFDVKFTPHEYNFPPLLHLAFEQTQNIKGAPVYDLLRNGADLHQRDYRGFTLFHYVKRTNAVEDLLNHGLDPNAQSDNGTTPLMRVVVNDIENVDLVRALIRGGADVTLRNEDGETALDIAKEMAGDTPQAQSVVRILEQEERRIRAEQEMRDQTAQQPEPSITTEKPQNETDIIAEPKSQELQQEVDEAEPKSQELQQEIDEAEAESEEPQQEIDEAEAESEEPQQEIDEAETESEEPQQDEESLREEHSVPQNQPSSEEIAEKRKKLDEELALRKLWVDQLLRLQKEGVQLLEEDLMLIQKYQELLEERRQLSLENEQAQATSDETQKTQLALSSETSIRQGQVSDEKLAYSDAGENSSQTTRTSLSLNSALLQAQTDVFENDQGQPISKDNLYTKLSRAENQANNDEISVYTTNTRTI